MICMKFVKPRLTLVGLMDFRIFTHELEFNHGLHVSPLEILGM